MIQKIQKHLNNRKGFTLIELIVVIVILGILAAILVPTFSGYATKARNSADEAAVANLKTVLAVAKAEGNLVKAKITVDTTGYTVSTEATETEYANGFTEAKLKDAINATIPGLKVKGTTKTIVMADTGVISIT